MIEIALLGKALGHKNSIYALVAGDNKGTFCSAGGDGFVVQWSQNNFEQGKLLAQIPETIFSIDYCATDNLLCAACMSGYMYIFDLQSKNVLHKIQFGNGALFKIKIQNKIIYTADANGKFYIYNLSKNAIVNVLSIGNAAIRNFNFYLGKVFITSSDYNVYTLDLESSEINTLLQHKNSVFALCLADHDLWTGGRDAMINITNVKENPSIVKQSIPAHNLTVNALAYNEQLKLIASASRDKTVKIWEATTAKLLKVLDYQKYQSHSHSVNNLLWLNTHCLVTCADDRSICLWHIEKK